ncbi:hypothetical protein [Bacillus sp. UNCCL81]|uniref:hypothetical protein n=1 Tax=Bacillus sp. UNCCL81 TaxID=1502755 RepID=UPI0008ED283E|nr:hypothetical protein [Bacillus sp. UNCCL81]SFD61897.1 hypothetical protein SAMN02799633_04309 [Bacillus sp. UNCCL81]
MDFILPGIIFWTLIIVGLFFFIYGLWKNSWKALNMSALFLLPMLYFVGAGDSIRLLGFVPLIPFILAFYKKKRSN